MADHKLSYHRHLDKIVAADVAYVRDKDAQYDASWKTRGGVGAWFTIVRPWDRLSRFMDKPKERVRGEPEWGAGYPRYDIFEGIKSEGLDGPDGSIIACVRDLRRYLLLVEAEMIEVFERQMSPFKRQFKVGKAEDVKPLGPDFAGMDYADIEARIISWMRDEKADTSDDMYAKFANETGLTHEQVKARLFAAAYGDNSESIAELGRRTFREGIREEGEPNPDPLAHLAKLVGAGRVLSHMVTDRDDADGRQHASLYPWVADSMQVARLRPTASEAWDTMAPSVFVLAARIAPEIWSALPTALRGVYTPVYLKSSADSIFEEGTLWHYCDDEPEQDGQQPLAYWLDVEKAPHDERQRWRELYVEQNATEWRGLMEYGELYAWHPGPGKFVLRNRHLAWARGGI